MLKVARPTWQTREFDKPLVTASYFGFTPINCPKISDTDLSLVKHCNPHPYYDAAEKAALIRTYIEENLAAEPHPLALAYKRRKPLGYSLHYIGASSGIAEAALIRAALSMLAEEGHKNMRVELNCVGDKDSLSAYERELANYVKKANPNLDSSLRDSLRENIFNLFKHEEEEIIHLRENAPSALSFLSTASRSHFKEVLEFVEGLNVDFGLAPQLVGEKNHSSHTIFGIRAEGSEREVSTRPDSYLAVGYRYSRLGKRLGLRKDVPMASVSVFSQEKDAAKKVYKELPKPKFYLIQLGREAKIKTLSLLEMLRHERIPVHHFLGKDKLSFQLGSAETLRVPYLIIIGHKEALDGTATIRNMTTRAQDTIPLGNLPTYLKHIRL